MAKPRGGLTRFDNSRVPVLHEVRDITLARNDQVALVSYENKVSGPFVLGKFASLSNQLSRRHHLNCGNSTQSRTLFGSHSDIRTCQRSLSISLALATSEARTTSWYSALERVSGGAPVVKHGLGQLTDTSLAGDIHIWDRESGTLLQHIRAQTVGGDLTCIAWNHAWDTFMFATGSHDGGVRIWTTPPHITGSIESSAVPSRGTTTPANTPRTMSPAPYDADYRTDSPTGQTESASPEGSLQPTSQNAFGTPSVTLRPAAPSS